MNLQSEHLTESNISTFAELLDKISPAGFFSISIQKDRVSFLGSFNRVTIDEIKAQFNVKFELNQESNFVETEINYGTLKVKITLT